MIVYYAAEPTRGGAKRRGRLWIAGYESFYETQTIMVGMTAASPPAVQSCVDGATVTGVSA